MPPVNTATFRAGFQTTSGTKRQPERETTGDPGRGRPHGTSDSPPASHREQARALLQGAGTFDLWAGLAGPGAGDALLSMRGPLTRRLPRGGLWRGCARQRFNRSHDSDNRGVRSPC